MAPDHWTWRGPFSVLVCPRKDRLGVLWVWHVREPERLRYNLAPYSLGLLSPTGGFRLLAAKMRDRRRSGVLLVGLYLSCLLVFPGEKAVVQHVKRLGAPEAERTAVSKETLQLLRYRSRYDLPCVETSVGV